MEAANQRLEELSEKVRKGCPIGFLEALEVIKYQESLKNKNKNKKWYQKLFDTLTIKN